MGASCLSVASLVNSGASVQKPMYQSTLKIPGGKLLCSRSSNNSPQRSEPLHALTFSRHPSRCIEPSTSCATTLHLYRSDTLVQLRQPIRTSHRVRSHRSSYGAISKKSVVYHVAPHGLSSNRLSPLDLRLAAPPFIFLILKQPFPPDTEILLLCHLTLCLPAINTCSMGTATSSRTKHAESTAKGAATSVMASQCHY